MRLSLSPSISLSFSLFSFLLLSHLHSMTLFLSGSFINCATHSLWNGFVLELHQQTSSFSDEKEKLINPLYSLTSFYLSLPPSLLPPLSLSITGYFLLFLFSIFVLSSLSTS